METTERQDDRILDFISLFQGKSLESAIYSILSAVANGDIEQGELKELSDANINSFPPSEYFSKYADELTPDRCRELLEGVSSAEDFKETAAFKTITADPVVVDRFERATPEVFGLEGDGHPAYWPKEYIEQLPRLLRRGVKETLR